MSSLKKPDERHAATSISSVATESLDRFSSRGVNVVVLVLLLVTYLQLFVEPDFFNQPAARYLLIIGLGLLYGFLGTQGMMVQETHPSFAVSILYFLVQSSITFFLIILTRDFGGAPWLLTLPIAAQSLSLPRLGTAVVTLSLLIGVWAIFGWGQSWQDAILTILSIGAAMLFTLVFTQIAVRESTARQQIQHLASDLRQANHRLAEYAAQVEELATMRERNRLAREIHDNLGHYLTVVNVQIEAAKTVMTDDPERAQDALNKAQQLTQDGLNAIRRSVSALRESPLENRTLPEAIGELIEETGNAGLAAELTITGQPRELDAQLTLTLYRVAMEGLTNVRKHARASQVTVRLDYEQNDRVHLRVADNGLGTGAADTTKGGFGLIGIRERVQLLDGEFTITTAPGSGFVIDVTLPT